MKKKKILTLFLILISSISFLSAKSLESLVNDSIETSTQITNLELNRNYTLLVLESSDLDTKTKISVGLNAYTLSAENSSSNKYSQYYVDGGTSKLLNIVIPGSYTPTSAEQVSDTTTISLDGGILYDSESSNQEFDVRGNLSVSHNFLIGDYTNNRTDLENQITLLNANKTYELGLITFKENVYNYVSSILNNEKSQREFEKKIKDQQTLIDNSLALNKINKDSITYKQYSLILKTYQDTLATLKIQYQSLIESFKDYTGLDYESVDEIREPNLEIPETNEDSLSVEIARLNVRLKQDFIDQVEREKTQSYMNVGTSIDRPYAIYSSSTRYNEDMSVAAQATYTADNFSINAATQVNIDFTDNTYTPGFKIGGTWTNDTTTDKDIIDNKINENELVKAQLELNSTLQSKFLTKLSLNSDVINWMSQYNQLKDQLDFNQDNLNLQKQMLEVGLVSQSEIDDLIFDIEQLNYDKKMLLIDGLNIELDIAKMNL